MADAAYTYGVARIRAKEVRLFSDSDIEQLLSGKSYEAALAFLREKGWGAGDAKESAEEMLATETRRTWEEIKDLASDEDAFSVLTIPKEYHNLKAAIKQVCTGDTAEGVYYTGIGVSPEALKEMIEKRNFLKLSDDMAKAAAEATEALLQTEDGQLCDIIIDRAALAAVKKAGEKSGSDFIREYADEMVTVADIRIAVRSAKTGKSRGFMERAMVPSDRLSISLLMDSALKGVDSICDYLKNSGFGDAADCIQESSSAFERWCDNRIMDTIQSQKYNSFSVGPILAYALARENEIKTVRIILTGKNNNLSDDFIRERIRKMYV